MNREAVGKPYHVRSGRLDIRVNAESPTEAVRMAIQTAGYPRLAPLVTVKRRGDAEHIRATRSILAELGMLEGGSR